MQKVSKEWLWINKFHLTEFITFKHLFLLYVNEQSINML